MTSQLLIVGGTHGIGKEIARRYAEQGWSVVLTGRDGSHAKSVAAELGGDTRGIALDLSEPEQVADALADVDAVDHLVLSAIIRDTNTLDDYDIASARYLVIMKLVGYHRCGQRDARPVGGGRLDRAVRRTGQGPSLPGRDDGRYRQRRHLRHGASRWPCSWHLAE